MKCVNNLKNKNIFQDINYIIDNIDSFELYSIKKTDIFINKNQLFTEVPPFTLVKKILNVIITKELNDTTYYEFCRKHLVNKNILSKINEFMPELKKYYLKCKHNKYLENLNEKKIITLLRQILKPYDFNIRSIEKYDYNGKFLLYIIEKKKNLMITKINSVINFD
jgi:hypothetical protein